MKEANQIITDLKRRLLKPIYFLCGEEAYYIDLISNYIEHNILDESEREFNQTILYGKDVDLNTIISAAKRFPMMSEYQVVIVKEAQNIRELNKSVSSDDDDNASSNKSSNATNSFISYLQNPQNSTILVFCYKYKSLDKRGSIFKTIQKKNHVFLNSEKIYDDKVPGWITNYITEKKYKLAPNVANLIAESLGNDLSKVANEIEKLFINLKEGDEITLQLVQDNIGISKEFNVFELQKALTDKNILKANQIINYFASNEKDHPAVMVLSSLYGYFTKTLQYHFIPDKSKTAVATALGVNPYFVDGIAASARSYNTAKLKAIFGYLREYDLKTKGVDNVGISNGELMKELVFKILH